MEAIKGVSEISKLKEDDVSMWYRSIPENQPANLGDKLAEVIRNHRHNPNANEAWPGVQYYVFTIMTDLRKIDGASLMRDKGQAKSSETKISNFLQSKELMELLFRENYMWKEQ